jgi:hypothetical protein
MEFRIEDAERSGGRSRWWRGFVNGQSTNYGITRLQIPEQAPPPEPRLEHTSRVAHPDSTASSNFQSQAVTGTSVEGLLYTRQ